MNKELEQLVENAELWNALPLLFHVLGKDNIPIPRSLLSLSRIQYIQNYLSTTLLLRELRDVLSSLADGGVEVIVLKGAALSANLYPNLGLRPLRDIDLLIQREELAQLIEILCTLGYERCLPPARDGIENLQGEIPLVKDGEFPLVIEPHWTLGPQYPYSGRIKPEGLWHRARRVNLAGVDTLVLCPEDSLLHACLHLLQHAERFWLIPACDIAELIRHYQGSLDWEAFLNRALEFELCLPVQYSLKKAFELFHPPIPSFVFNELSSYEPSRFENRLFALHSSLSGPVRPGNLAKLLTIPGISQKLRYLSSILLPSKEWLMFYYSNSKPKPLNLYALHMKNVFLTGPKLFFHFAFRAK
ncbi:MAG: nucleotidyltransferase family protein [Dehalococcoidia bacterium]